MINESMKNAYNNIMIICHAKIHAARILDKSFKEDDYLWILGPAIYNVLKLSDELYSCPDGECYIERLFGIPVKLDGVDKNTISLYKEIK